MKPILHLLLIVTLTILSLPSMGQGVVTIPTVVHVVWHDSTENISDAQIQSQMNVLNADFRKLNADTSAIPAPFRPFAGDAQIEFCLAQRDTSGNPTTGIIRTYTTATNFGDLDSISETALGGQNGWNPTKYLNIWVVNIEIDGRTVSFATLPSELSLDPEEDGIYMPPILFGTIGTGYSSYAGRETDRQVAKWLGLNDLQGYCFNDSIADIPPVDTPWVFATCPFFPHNPNSACGTNSNGEMATNFMTFAIGNCRNFFTNGQIARMHAALNNYRSGLLTSDGCLPVGINELTNNMNLKLFPNPSSGTFSITTHNLQKAKLEIYNLMGSIIYEQSLTSPQSAIDISREASGIYFVFVTDGTDTWAQKIIKE